MPTWDQIVKALENEKYKWRTIRGVAKAIKASEDEVLKFIKENESEIIKSSIPAETGEELYTTRNHYRRTASPFDKLVSSFTTSVSSSGSSVSRSSSSVSSGWEDKNE